MEIIDTVKQRWLAETPKFFVGVKKLAISLGSSATAIWVTNESMSLNLHETVLEVCKYIITFSAAMGLTAQLTQNTPPVENEEKV